jgi:hypothetical protein
MKHIAKQRRVCLIASLVIYASALPALADSITFGGAISQSTQDGTGPAANNASLNSIADGDVYAVFMLNFVGLISGPGQFALKPAGLGFQDTTAGVDETAFGGTPCGTQTSLGCLTVSVDASDSSFDDISLLGCVTTGSGCLLGNELDVNFRIPGANLNSQHVLAGSIPGLTPLDLLEDDGSTDIQGTVTKYSYTPAIAVPEPSFRAPLSLLLTAMPTALRLRCVRARHDANSTK